MNCQEAEEKIYLYSELSLAECEQVDQHLSTCVSCRQTMSRVTFMQQVIVGYKAEVPRIMNEAHMTRRIMDAVQQVQQRKITRWDGILQGLHANTLRYGMGALSFALVGFFVAEYTGGQNIGTVTKFHPQRANKTELNLASFHNAFFSARQNDRQASTLISECVAGCVYGQDADCKKCSEKFAKQ